MGKIVSGGTVISREYLKYSGKGSERKAIEVINRDYKMNKFRQQIRSIDNDR